MLHIELTTYDGNEHRVLNTLPNALQKFHPELEDKAEESLIIKLEVNRSSNTVNNNDDLHQDCDDDENLSFPRLGSLVNADFVISDKRSVV